MLPGIGWYSGLIGAAYTTKGASADGPAELAAVGFIIRVLLFVLLADAARQGWQRRGRGSSTDAAGLGPSSRTLPPSP